MGTGPSLRLGKSTAKLIIQIPCLDEEQTLAVTLDDPPEEIPGIDHGPKGQLSTM